LLLDPESFDIGISVLVREIIKHAVVAVYFIELLGKLLNFVRSVFNELTSSNKLTLICRLSHDGLVHLFVSLENLLHGFLAITVHVFEELLLDLGSLMTELLFHFAGHNAEKREVNLVVGKILNFHECGLIMLNPLTELFESGLLFSSKEFLDKCFAVDVEDVLVLLILVKKVKWTNDVVCEHLLNLSHGFNNPWEVFSNGEIRLLFLL